MCKAEKGNLRVSHKSGLCQSLLKFFTVTTFLEVWSEMPAVLLKKIQIPGPIPDLIQNFCNMSVNLYFKSPGQPYMR